MRNENKVFVELLGNVNHRQLFFLIWAAIVGGSILGMISYYRRYTRSNFREPGERRPTSTPLDLHRLAPKERKAFGHDENGRKGA